MKAFRREDARGQVVAELDGEERAVVARVVADVGLLLGAEPFGADRPATPDAEDELFRHLAGWEERPVDPRDPAVLRLLPNAAPTDQEVADEFRRLTEGDLRDLKVQRLRRIWEALSATGPEWAVDVDEALPTAAALTDVRLVLAARLGLEDDADVDRLHHEVDLAMHFMDGDDAPSAVVDGERVWLGMLYEALAWLQESLLQCIVDQGEVHHA